MKQDNIENSDIQIDESSVKNRDGDSTVESQDTHDRDTRDTESQRKEPPRKVASDTETEPRDETGSGTESAPREDTASRGDVSSYRDTVPRKRPPPRKDTAYTRLDYGHSGATDSMPWQQNEEHDDSAPAHFSDSSTGGRSGHPVYSTARRERPVRLRNRSYVRRRVDKIKTQNLIVDYKHPEILRRFITEKGKILPRRITGTSASNQRRLVCEIKRARFLALLPMG